jgi:hypothetical protein
MLVAGMINDLVIFNFCLVHMKELTYKSEVLLENLIGFNMRGE